MSKKKITVDNPEQLAELVELARKASDTDNPVTLLFNAFEAHLDDVTEHNERVEEAQSRARSRLGLDDGDTVAQTSEHTRRSDDVCDDVAAKQAELRDKFFD